MLGLVKGRQSNKNVVVDEVKLKCINFPHTCIFHSLVNSMGLIVQNKYQCTLGE